MIDPRFGYTKSSDGGVRHRLSSKRFDTVPAAYDDWVPEAARREDLAGRPLTREELINGIARPDGRSDRERRDAERRRASELNPVTPDERTPAEKYRDTLVAEQEEARLSALSPRERRLLRAEQAVAAEQAEAVQAEAKVAALSTDAGKRLRREVDAAILHAMYSPDVPQADLEELRHQAALLDTFGDVASVGKNVVTIQTNLLAGLTTQADALKASADKITARAAKLRGEPEPPKPTADIKTLLS